MADAPPTEDAPARPRSWVVVALLVLVPGLFLGRAFLPRRVLLPVDPVAFEPLASEHPERAAQARLDANHWLSDGTLPFASDVLRQQTVEAGDYAPTLGLGRSVPGHSLVDTSYPPNHLLVALPLGLGAAALGWLHLLVAGLGMWGWLRARGFDPIGQVTGALAVQAGGWGLMHLQLSMVVGAVAWMPLAGWAIERILDRRRGGVAQLAVAVGLLGSAGFPSVAAPIGLALVVVALARAFSSGRPDRLPAITGGLAAGLLLAAPALVPMASAAVPSARGAESVESLATQRLPRAALGTIVTPHLFGEPDAPFFAGANPAAWWVLGADERDLGERANGLEWNLHAGLIVTLLAAAGIAGRPKRSLPVVVGIVVILGFAFAWPPFRGLLHVPGLDLGAPTRATALLWIAVPWLAARGASSLADGCHRSAFVAMGLATVVGLFSAWSLLGTVEDEFLPVQTREVAARFDVPLAEVEARLPEALGSRAREDWKRAYLWAGFLAAAGAVLCVLRLGNTPRRVAALLPIAVVGEGVLLASVHLAPRMIDGEVFPASPTMEALAEATGTGRTIRLVPPDADPGVALELARPDLPSAYGIGDLAPYAVFTPRAEVELAALVDPQVPYRSGLGPFRDARVLDHRALDLWRVTSVISTEPIDHPGFTPALARDGFHVASRADAWPDGARIYPRVTTVPRTFLEALSANAIDPLRDLCVQDEEPARGPAPTDLGALQVTWPAPERCVAQVVGGAGGWLVMPFGFSSGWRATTADGPLEVRRAQHLLAAVRIPPGDLEVTWTFDPPGQQLGRLLAGIGLIGLALGALRANRARRAT